MVSYSAGGVIDSRYRVRQNLGKGSYGEVYEVEDLIQQQIVALKLLDLQAQSNWPWAREAVLLTQLRSEFILPVWNASIFAGTPYIVTEVANGGAANALIANGNRPTPRIAVRLIREASRGAARAHDAGVVHRDIKLENIFLNENGGALLGDFGMACPLVNGVAPKDGTPATAAPEVFRDGGESSVLSDIYSLGCSLYALLTGKYPYHDRQPQPDIAELQRLAATGTPTPLRDLAPHASVGLAKIVHKAMHLDPAERYATATELDSALGNLSPPKRDWTCHIPQPDSTRWVSDCAKPIEVCVQPISASTNQIHVAYVNSRRRITEHCSSKSRSQTSAALKRVFKGLGY